MSLPDHFLVQQKTFLLTLSRFGILMWITQVIRNGVITEIAPMITNKLKLKKMNCLVCKYFGNGPLVRFLSGNSD
jgi:hypothetical protein